MQIDATQGKDKIVANVSAGISDLLGAPLAHVV